MASAPINVPMTSFANSTIVAACDLSSKDTSTLSLNNHQTHDLHATRIFINPSIEKSSTPTSLNATRTTIQSDVTVKKNITCPPCHNYYYENTSFNLNDERDCDNRSKANSGCGQNLAPNSNSPILLSWKNLRYEVTEWSLQSSRPKSRKVILRRLNGSVRQNTLNALLGPSGAGKTSLIKCLTGNVSNKNISSDTEIYLNRTMLNEKHGRMPLAGFVPQLVHETIFGRFTAEEILYYAFRFKNPYSKRHLAREHIQNIIEELMLDRLVLQTRFEQCSGGEQRRIAIAQELMSMERKPPFLFVDEPTTGLDSEAALLVMQCLRRLTERNPITIIVSIHAPSSDILNLFDQLFVLAKGGVCIYSDGPQNMQCHLREVLHVELDDDRPAIEEYLRIASNGINDDQVRKLADDTLNREHRRLTNREDGCPTKQQQRHLQHMPEGVPRHPKCFRFDDLFIQLGRLFRLIFVLDSRMFLFIILINSVFMSFISIVSNRDMVRPSGCYPYDLVQLANRTCQQELDESLLTGTYIIYQLVSFIMITATALGFSSVLLVDLLKVFRVEHLNGWYSLGTFFWSYQLVHLVEFSVFALSATTITYITAGYMSIDGYRLNMNRFGHFLLFNWLLMMYLQSHGHLWGTVFMQNIQIMTIFSQLIFANMNILNGVAVTLEIMDKPFVLFVSRLIGVRYITEGLLYSFYGIDRCDPQQEYSVILKKYHVDPDLIYWNLIPAIINIIALRCSTLVLTYWRFSFRGRNRLQKPMIGHTAINTKSITDSQYIPLDYNCSTHLEITEKTSEKKDQIFQEKSQFCQERYMIGWRGLSLFASGSIYETRPLPKTIDSAKRSERLILRNLNGQLRFGTINALMGTSGSGKTSLLKVLNGRMKTRLADSTKFYLSKFVPIRTCFITQEISGHLLPGLTAKQSLIYASRLKNCRNEYSGQQLEQIQHEQLAMRILEELDITDTANTMVQRCSDGQRKRLALGLELTSVRMPNLICIDEPTSGLDSNSARLVIDCLQRLVRRHPDITIVASIHQPNTELLFMFDQCYVLARDGVCIYSGHPGEIKTYLEKVPESRGSTRFPIETLIKYSCTGQNNPVVKKLTQQAEQQTKQEADQDLFLDTVAIADGVAFNRTRFSLGSVGILCQRYSLYLIRHQWKEWLAYISIYLSIGFSLICFFNKSIAEPSGCINLEDDFMAFCSNKSDENLLQEMQIANNINYISYSSSIFCLALSVQTMFTFTNEMKYFLNEHRNGWYSCGAFYMKKFLFETIPLIPIVMAYVYIVDIYETVSPNDFYGWQVLIMILASMSFQAISHFVALMTNGHFIMMILTLAFFLSAFLMLSNVFNPIDQLPYVLQFISNFSILRYINQSGFWLVYGGERCSENEIQSILYQLMVPNTREHFNYCIMMLAILVFVYHSLALFMLIFKANPISNRLGRVERIQKYHQEQLLKLQNTEQGNNQAKQDSSDETTQNR